MSMSMDPSSLGPVSILSLLWKRNGVLMTDIQDANTRPRIERLLLSLTELAEETHRKFEQRSSRKGEDGHESWGLHM